MIGPDHVHWQTYTVQVPSKAELPNIERRFLRGDGSIKFDSILAEFETGFAAQKQTYDQNNSMASNDDEFCVAMSEWQLPDDDPPTWMKQQLAWRNVARVEFVEGMRKVPGKFVDGGRRLTIGTYVQIGYRKSNSKEYSAIHLAGPFQETSYQPVGKGEVSLAAWAVKERVSPGFESYDHSALESLNLPLTESEMAFQKEEKQKKKGSADRPTLQSVGGFPMVGKLHKALHEILSPGKAMVP